MGATQGRADGHWVAVLEELAEIRRRVDAVEHLTVQQVRSEGKSWARIGTALGISRQAARQRFTVVRRR